MPWFCTQKICMWNQGRRKLGPNQNPEASGKTAESSRSMSGREFLDVDPWACHGSPRKIPVKNLLKFQDQIVWTFICLVVFGLFYCTWFGWTLCTLVPQFIHSYLKKEVCVCGSLIGRGGTYCNCLVWGRILDCDVRINVKPLKAFKIVYKLDPGKALRLWWWLCFTIYISVAETIFHFFLHGICLK